MPYLINKMRPQGDPKILKTGRSSFSASDRLARNLGWFSIGLGLAHIFAAEKITGALGMRGSENLVRAYGAREIGSGMMTLSVEKEAGLATRLAGDALDIAALMTAMYPGNRKRGNVGVALALVAGVTLLDIVAFSAARARHRRHEGETRSYGDRTGFPGGVEAARRAARKDLADQRHDPEKSIGKPADTSSAAKS